MDVANLEDDKSPGIMHYRKAHSVPCRGDFIEVVPSAGERTYIAIADICGRGTQAQGHARYLRDVFRSLADGYSPAELLELMNIAFCCRVGDHWDDNFATVFVAALKGRSLAYASAGHEFAMLMDSNGKHRHLAPTGMLIGIEGNGRYVEQMLDVAPGDWLVVVTDGITDARDTRGTFFGTSGVVRSATLAIRQAVDNPAARILEAARTHGCDGLVDDASVLCVRLSGRKTPAQI
jgi:sigma-B regulation protein RsbU (phosphoserine phosphatase)